MSQPIIRGIQAVGAVDIKYRYNSSDNKLNLPSSMRLGGEEATIDTKKFIDIAGFRLDGEFLRAVQQIASSVQIPILGGGAIALTNNNRSGTLTIGATRVSTPTVAQLKYTEDVYDKDDASKLLHKAGDPMGPAVGAMAQGGGIGPVGTDLSVYDLTFIAQVQQAQAGGDSVGSTIQVIFQFNGMYTVLEFQGCTIASVDPVGLSGNDAVNYNVSINYLNWTVNYSSANDTPVVE